jgi:curli biogenesis system outer membrane secretion channel CsgG
MLTRLVAITLILAGCSSAAPAPSPTASPAAFAAPAAAGALQPSVPMTTGPRKRIAVAKFDAHGAFMSVYGGWDIGGGLAAQLTTALVNSGHFIVVERAELASVLREQELGLTGIVSKETAAQVGQVLGAQILVRGAVTEFEQRAGGGGLRLGVASGPFGGALGAQSTAGIVGMDLRLIDTTTGQVVRSRRAESKIEQRGLSADINVQQVTFGGDAFDKTVLGQATRQAIERAVAEIVASSQVVPWTGRVVDVAGEQVFLNAGSASGLKAGDRFAISTVVRELTDPATGLSLGVIEQKLGEVRVVSTQDNFSIAAMVAPFQTQRGDLVKVAGQ